jgi:hypothetical protein
MVKASRDLLLILISAIAAHGLLLINDGIYLDDWVLTPLGTTQEIIDMHFFLAGAPRAAWYHWILGCFPGGVLVYRLVTFGCIVLSGILVYQIARMTNRTTHQEALLLSLFSVVWPAYQVNMHAAAVVVPLQYCWFLLATFLGLLSAKLIGYKRFCLRTVSLCFFLLSFNYHSLLVFYLGFLLLVFVAHLDSDSGSDGQKLKRFCSRNPDYIVLPLIYWIMNNAFSRHPSGVYDGYNKINFSIKGILDVFVGFSENAVYGQLTTTIVEILNHPLFSLTMSLIIIASYRLFDVGTTKFFSSKITSSTLLKFGLALFFLGVFPYAVVGKAASLMGFSTRHAILISLPLAIVLVAITRILFSDSNGIISSFGFASVMMLILGCVLVNVKNYTCLQARWVKDQSIIYKISTLQGAADTKIFWIHDFFPVGTRDPLEYYRFYEWASFFKRAFGNEERVGIDVRAAQRDFFESANFKQYSTKFYVLSDFDPKGCQAILTILPGPNVLKRTTSEIEMDLIKRYYYIKFLGKQSMKAFLTGVTELKIDPIITTACNRSPQSPRR